MNQKLAIFLLLLIPLAVAAQQIFKTTDEHGNVIFTDQPPPNADAVEEVQLNRTNSAPPPPEIQALEPAPAPEPDAVAYDVAITAPANETTIPMGPGNFAVSAAAEPGLPPGGALLLRIDGEPWGEPGPATSWQLTNVFRGAHDLTVAVLDADGQPLAISEPVRVYVLRPSVNFRN